MNDSEDRWFCTECRRLCTMAHAAVHKHIIHVPHDLVAAICAEQREKDINALCAAVPPCSLRDYALAAIREGKEE